MSHTAYTLLLQPLWFSSTLLLSRSPQPFCLSVSLSHSRPCLLGSSLGLVPSCRPRAFRPPSPVAPPCPPAGWFRCPSSAVPGLLPALDSGPPQPLRPPSVQPTLPL
eukprot:994557-Prorocentrum_minimum.AAC.2